MFYHVSKIEWDTDGFPVNLPDEVTINANSEDDVMDRISFVYGYCVISAESITPAVIVTEAYLDKNYKAKGRNCPFGSLVVSDGISSETVYTQGDRTDDTTGYQYVVFKEKRYKVFQKMINKIINVSLELVDSEQN